MYLWDAVFSYFNRWKIVTHSPISTFKNLKIRRKLLVIILPLVVLPIFLIGGMIGYVATQQAYGRFHHQPT